MMLSSILAGRGVAPSRGSARVRGHRGVEARRRRALGIRAGAGERDAPGDQGPAGDPFGPLPEAVGRAALEALFLAKATADVANEAAGRVVGEVLAEVAKFDAERDTLIESAVREIQERAAAELAGALGQGGIPATTTSSVAEDAAPPLSTPAGTVVGAPAAGADAEVEAAVDNLRAEVARAAAERNALARELRGPGGGR